MQPLFSDRRRTKFSSTPEVEDPLEQKSEASLIKQSRDRPNSDGLSSSDDEEDGIVYGIVKTHAPARAPQVRDPTKEILRGLWGSDSNRIGGSRRPPFSYGRVHTHQKTKPKTESPFNVLQEQLFGSRKESSERDNNVFGTVHRFSPSSNSGEASAASIDSVSRLDQVRSLLNKESKGRKGDLASTDFDLESSSSPNKNAFDRIREKLLNTRARERFHMSRERNLRRKGSKKRRRNVSMPMTFFCFLFVYFLKLCLFALFATLSFFFQFNYY